MVVGSQLQENGHGLNKPAELLELKNEVTFGDKKAGVVRRKKKQKSC